MSPCDLFELAQERMKLTQHQGPTGVALRSALAALLLAVSLPALAQFKAAPKPAPPEPASQDLIAQQMFAALVTIFQGQMGAAVQAQHVAQNTQPQSPPQAPSPLGVEQVRPAQASASAPKPKQQAQPVQSDALQTPGVRPGVGTAGQSQADTSASCAGDNASAECMLPGQAATDWKKQTGLELDPVSGAPLIPGVTLNPTVR